MNNQGLSEVTVTSGTAGYKAGKIGQGLDLNSRVYFNCSDLYGCKKFTICFWAKIENDSGITANWQDIIGFTDQRTDNASTGQLRAETCYGASYAETNNGRYIHWHNNTTYSFSDFTVYHTSNGETQRGVWHHCVLAVDADNGIWGYTDGKLVTTNGGTVMNSGHLTGEFWVGETGYIQGVINDIRIYKDEILSPRKIKEISKGLVCHYTLAMPGNENLIVTNSMTPTSGTSGWGSAGTGWAISNVGNNEASSGRAIHCTYSGTAQVSGGIHHPIGVAKEELIDGAVYTVSARIRASKNCRATFHNELQGANVIDLTTYWKVYTFSDIIDTSRAYYSNTIYALTTDVEQNMWIECDWIKFEKGSVATPWIPNPANAEFTKMGFDDGIEYDVSGYGHNGIKTGSIKYPSDTQRYLTSTHITATNQKIHLSDFQTTGFSNSYSFAWWGKRNSNTTMFWGFSDGIRLNGMYNGNLWNTGDGSANPIYNIGTATQVTSPTLNEWHHYVMTGNGTKCYVYLDGVLWGEAKTYKAINGTSIYINGWNSETEYSSNDIYISDFRIYATALSAEDVKQLYNTPMSLTSNGVLMTQGEFTEV